MKIDDKNKEKVESKNIFQKSNLIGNNNGEEKSSNLFFNNDKKETKSITINAVDTSNSLFNTKEEDKKTHLFGDVGFFGKTDNNKENQDNKTTSLFGTSNLFNNTKNESLFGNATVKKMKIRKN